MIVQIFKSMAVMSVMGSITAILLFALKPLNRRLFGHKWQYYIYLLPLVILSIPVRINLSVSVFPEKTASLVRQAQYAINYVPELMPLQNNESLAEHTASVGGADIILLLACIWVIGAILAFSYKIVRYLLFVNTLNKNAMRDEKLSGFPIAVKRTNMLDAPLIAGLFKPTLYLQQNDANLDAIVLHELTHFKRRDLWYKWYAMIVGCIHWFNPVVHILLKEIDTECEISCDCQVSQEMSDDEKHTYMNEILAVAQRAVATQTQCTTHIAGDKNLLKKRFKAILKSRSLSRKTVFAGCLIAVLICGVCIVTSTFIQSIDSIKSDVSIKNIINETASMFITEAPQPLRTQAPESASAYEPVKENTLATNAPLATAVPVIETFIPTMQPSAEPTTFKSDLSLIKQNSQSLDEYINCEFYCFDEDFSTNDLSAILDRNGIDRTSKLSADLKSQYISGSYSFESGCLVNADNVKCDENGIITLYFNSSADQLIDIVFTQTGDTKELAGFGVTADNQRAYSFSGFEQGIDYSVKIQGATKKDWEIEGDFIIY